jgi:hypothetical protein
LTRPRRTRPVTLPVQFTSMPLRPIEFQHSFMRAADALHPSRCKGATSQPRPQYRQRCWHTGKQGAGERRVDDSGFPAPARHARDERHIQAARRRNQIACGNAVITRLA